LYVLVWILCLYCEAEREEIVQTLKLSFVSFTLSLSPCKESMAFIDFVDFAVVILTRKLVFHVSQIPITFQATNEILLKVFMLSAQDKKICIIVLQDLCQ
jgi:hypothetical protein